MRNGATQQKRLLMSFVAARRAEGMSWAAVTLAATELRLWSGSVTGLRVKWSRERPEDWKQRRLRARHRRKLIARTAELAEELDSPTQIAAVLRYEGHRSIEGARVDRRIVGAMLVRYGLRVDREDERPRQVAECPSYRPCPFLRCRYHLGVEVVGRQILFTRPEVEEGDLSTLPWSCALDAGRTGTPLNLKQIGTIYGSSKERIHHVFKAAMRKVAEADPETYERLVEIYELTKAGKRWSREAEEDIEA